MLAAQTFTHGTFLNRAYLNFMDSVGNRLLKTTGKLLMSAEEMARAIAVRARIVEPVAQQTLKRDETPTPETSEMPPLDEEQPIRFKPVAIERLQFSATLVFSMILGMASIMGGGFYFAWNASGQLSHITNEIDVNHTESLQQYKDLHVESTTAVLALQQRTDQQINDQKNKIDALQKSLSTTVSRTDMENFVLRMQRDNAGKDVHIPDLPTTSGQPSNP